MPTQFLVLTADKPVADATLATAADALGLAGAEWRRLAPMGADLPLDAPLDAGRLAGLGAELGVDLNCVPAAGRAKKLLIADMDSTMIPVECIDELADYAGVKPQVAEITERAMQGELDFEGAIHARVALLEGLPVAALQTCYDERVTLNPGAAVLVKTMAARGARTALVSGGFTFFTERVAAAAGFALNRANRLEVEGDRLTGKVGLPVLGRQAKLDTLREICGNGGFTPDAVIAVGDGANDLSMVEAAGLGVAYRAKPALADAADVRLDRSDLTALLMLQGIVQADWVAG
ncbi:phosphoserine phosphatase SerB [Oceanomicrobium pacificus]|uniref:Phosphoserine phosphatase n=1 Tax=Oceanomicrobium pacificus TaxID=2692916 RepID=A0A6B0TQC2_9RHOB|nr:phosphoserine phosphatase SerB [Oceanomicrobium pacificus]MXU66146.1 phosphoserine phosphatase SerB [Oceanomicrobium pacificus]